VPLRRVLSGMPPIAPFQMWIHRSKQSVIPISSQKYITFVGAGGKTSLAEYTAAALLKEGRRVAITTTTKIFVKEPYCLIGEDFQASVAQPFVRVGGSVEMGKLTAVSFEDLERIGSVYDVVLIEADGAKGKPLKFPATHEPVIPPFSDIVFVVAGLDGLFEKVNQKVFRWENFCQATVVDADVLITPEVFLRFFADDALLKGVDRGRCTVVLNKYDALMEREQAIEIGKKIILQTGIRGVVVSSALHRVFYHMEAHS
jgi:probable selenium-dependent hydroxylase accessory protein YqeC